jgi:hypothetical protein
MCSLLFHPPSDFEANATDAWYNDSWEYRKKITTSLDTVISSDLTDFPYLVSFTDSDLTKTTESDGTDIIFTASDGTTELAYEIERFDQSTGEVIAWVKIPTVSASENTDIYIYYKGTASSSSSSVWDSNYKLVYHLNQSSAGTVDEFVDASGTGNDGTGGGEGDKENDTDRIPTRVEAKIGYGQSFDGPTESNSSNEGTGDFIWTDSVNNWPGNNRGTTDNDSTVEFWLNVESDHDDVGMMDVFGYRSAGQHNEFTLFKVESLNLFVRGSALLDSTVDAATSDWTYLMIVYDPGGTSKIYQDGVLVAQVDGTSGNKGQAHEGNFILGAEIDGTTRVNNELVGDMDEFRISDTARSADWAAASYCNQNGSNDCQTIGPEEPLTVTITTSNGDCGDTVSSSAGSSITFSYTATFSTSTSDFTIGDITVTGTADDGSPVASNFAGSGTTYTFDVVVSSSGTVIVSIAADTATNTAGNGNSVSNTCTLTADIPVVTSSSSSPTTHCSRHIILGNCGTVAINDDVYSIIHTWTNVPTTEVLVGQPVTVTLSTPNNPTYTKIHFASVFTEIFNSPTNYDQSVHIDYSVLSGNHHVSDHVSQSQLFQVAGATHRIVQDTNVKNLEMFEVVFTMIFAKPMDTSHIVVETENKFGIPETLYLMNALKVNENLPQALTLEEKSKFELEYEPVMEPEPPMEPDVKNVTCGKGTVLKDNLCVPKEWSFLDFFKQLMKLFD